MGVMKKITTPLTKEQISDLKSGDRVLITGYIYTARDAAHKRLYDSIVNVEELPFELSGNIIYYAGPTPNKPGQVIGSCGPTTSGRMDKYTPLLIKNGLSGMIGKGERADSVYKSITEQGSVYFAAVGGLGALISKCVKECEIIAYSDLGTEAVRKLYVVDMPVTVVCDIYGNNLYKTR